MSDALNFLAKARPEAMGHYFSFLKDCGKHLDPKTRDLISLITKVHGQTPRGFRQYLKRALRDGCSAAEVLDALMMAFPALGLSKIIWAVDIILAMKLPAFEALISAAPAEADRDGDGDGDGDAKRDADVDAVGERDGPWHDLMAAADLLAGTSTRIEHQGRGLFVHHGDVGFLAFDSRCPHQGTDMPAAALQGHTLTCPMHGWSFDARSGQGLSRGATHLRALPCRVVNGRLLAAW